MTVYSKFFYVISCFLITPQKQEIPLYSKVFLDVLMVFEGASCTTDKWVSTSQLGVKKILWCLRRPIPNPPRTMCCPPPPHMEDHVVLCMYCSSFEWELVWRGQHILHALYQVDTHLSVVTPQNTKIYTLRFFQLFIFC